MEPYGPGDSEYAAGQRLLRRAVSQLGPRFADYLVVDGEYATAPFLHVADECHLPVVARLKRNLPELLQDAQKRFSHQPAKLCFRWGTDQIEAWDADDFDPWESLRWPTVRVLYYRQHKPNGDVFEAYWLTNLSAKQVSTCSLFRMAKSRWEIENQGFNEAKNQHGMEHIPHHHWSLGDIEIIVDLLYTRGMETWIGLNGQYCGVWCGWEIRKGIFRVFRKVPRNCSATSCN